MAQKWVMNFPAEQPLAMFYMKDSKNYCHQLPLLRKLRMCLVDYHWIISSCTDSIEAHVLIEPLLSTNINLYCLSFEIVVSWNDYLELRLQLWSPLKDFKQFKQEKLVQFSYGFVPNNLVLFEFINYFYVLTKKTDEPKSGMCDKTPAWCHYQIFFVV